ncbi:unnamed protein product [Caenorhabditis bovis]|uniref:ATP-dependent RNA helicase DDX1 n=1 Tax=Caenorhabditis bovis TaxID=2654633 RepID=A0A8S1EZ66_9PELO|nr:unnamed protein product [Caenorhabditis bovis]
MTAFEEFGVIPELFPAFEKLGWSLPTPVQAEAIPAILGGSDVLIAAETGSGKTGAVSVPVAQIVWERRRESEQKATKSENVQKEFVLNLKDRSPSLQIDQTGLVCESRVPKQWNGVRCVAGVHTKGKYYYEVTIKRDGLCRVGWATISGSLQIGTDYESFGYGGTGKKSFGKKFDDYGTCFTTNDVLGCFLDLDNLEIWWSKNGMEYHPGFKIAEKFRQKQHCLFPAMVLQNSSLEANFGNSPFKFAPRHGFVAVKDAELIKWYSAEEVVEADSNSPVCVILEPTRELVEQTFKNVEVFSTVLQSPSLRCVSLAAGVDMRTILSKLEAGSDIVVGTPSRIVDLIQSGKLAVHALQFVVIDEIDQFLGDNRGGGRQIDILFRHLPLVSAHGWKRQIIACSATMHNFEVAKFADRYMSFPQWIDLKGIDSVSNNVHHVVCRVDAAEDKQWIRVVHQKNHLEDDHIHDKDQLRLGTNDRNTLSFGTKILKGIYVLRAIKALKMDKAIIFCRTKQQCDHMEKYLRQNDYTAACLHGDRSAAERQASLEGFKDGKMAFLVCTDVVARGLDIVGVPFVINVNLPDDKTLYVHRIGRVGRADRMGLSVSLVSEHDEKVWFHKCTSRICTNSKELQFGGCAIWYQEKQYLAEIEEHLGCTISQIDSDFQVPVDEFDGKVVYGERRTGGGGFQGYGFSASSAVSQLADLESRMQIEFLKDVAYLLA